jgi:hypothetical protein
MSNSNEHRVERVNTHDYAVFAVTDEDGCSNIQMDFTLFEAKLDRFVTLVVKNKIYYLQLLTIENFTLIDEFPLSFDFSIMDYKLVGSIEWELTFGLGLKLKESRFSNDSKIYMYKVENDHIIDMGVSRDTNFSSLKASYKYLLVDDNSYLYSISALHYSNLSLAFPIDSYNSNAVKFEKNIVIITIYTS